MYRSKIKHTEIDTRFVGDKVANNEIDNRYIPSKDQISDILTKPLLYNKFNCF